MSKRRGLGKGLLALIPDVDVEGQGKDRLKELEINEIRPSVRQARQIFDKEKLDELADSIKEHGMIQPVIVRSISGGGYELIAGERRWRACKALGYNKIPAVIKECPDLEATASALIENIQREDLNPLEEALAYKQLMEEFDLTQEDVSGKVGKSRSFIANAVRLLDLPAEVQVMLASGKISAGHARALLAIKDDNKQMDAAANIVAKQLNVRQAEEIAREMIGGKEKEKKVKVLENQYLARTEERLKIYFSAGVRVKEKQRGAGRLEIDFSDGEDLKRIVGLLLGEGSD